MSRGNWNLPRNYSWASCSRLDGKVHRLTFRNNCVPLGGCDGSLYEVVDDTYVGWQTELDVVSWYSISSWIVSNQRQGRRNRGSIVGHVFSTAVHHNWQHVGGGWTSFSINFLLCLVLASSSVSLFALCSLCTNEIGFESHPCSRFLDYSSQLFCITIRDGVQSRVCEW